MPTLEVLEEIVHHTVVKVLTTQMSIPGSSLDLENSFLNGKEGDVERSPTQIEDEYILLLPLLVKTICNGSGSGFVDNT
jgi:hypothetical protein